jgi:hypothetical protein
MDLSVIITSLRLVSICVTRKRDRNAMQNGIYAVTNPAIYRTLEHLLNIPQKS